MNLQQLRYAHMLSEHGSFVEAAARCGVTQPTLSNGIAQLENELGVRLFARTTRTVNLTGHGHQLLPQIIDILNARAALIAKARELTEPEKQLVRIGVSPLVGMELVNLIIEPFRRFHSHIEIVFRELNLMEMAHLLDVAQLEFVFGPVNADIEFRTDLSRVQFYEEPLVFVAKGFPVTKAGAVAPVALSDIAKEMFVMVPDVCGLAKVTRSVFRQHRLKLSEYAGAAMSYRVLQEWAHLGIGAAILPQSKTMNGTGAEILLRKGHEERLMIGYQACWHKTTNPSSAVGALGAHLAKVARPIASGLADAGASR